MTMDENWQEFFVGYTRREFEQIRDAVVQKTIGSLQTPAHAISLDYKVRTTLSGEEVLNCEGLSLDRAANEPWLLLSGDAYDGGSPLAMDPFHAATKSLVELRFAIHYAVKHGDARTMRNAADRAGAFLRGTGVPPQIHSVVAIGTRRTAFEAIDLLALMPLFRKPAIWMEPPLTWRERAEASYLLMGALAGMPEDYPAREAAREYVWQLANPAISGALMEEYEERLRRALAKVAKGE